MSKSSLADKISDLLNTAPKLIDPEDDDVNYTQSSTLVEDAHQEESDDNYQEELLSKFRKHNVDLLADVDVRYDGKKASRKMLQSSDDKLSDNSEEGNDKSAASEGSTDEDNSNNETYKSDDEQEEDSDEEEFETDEDEMNFGDDSLTAKDENETNFVHIKETNMPSQIMKGLCVRNQMSVWETLLEMRIQLQKCVIASNKMPQTDTFAEMKKQSGQNFSDKVAETKKNVSTVLDKLITLQTLLLKQYPETKKLHKTDSQEKQEGSDEEIPSDTEDEKSEIDESDSDEETKICKKRKLSEYEDEINEQFKRYRSYRNNVIQKWNDKTRLAVAKASTPSHSVLNQIEHTLSDKSRLVKRTQLKRSEYEIIGEADKTQVESNEENIRDNKIVEEYNSNIYDDDDFYHQLLRELIEVKSADLTDPVQLGRQWIQLQNLRSKMKRKIDTKATKGRKIRYAIHSKLVNFMAPIDENSWTDEAKNELYSSLFGKSQISVK